MAEFNPIEHIVRIESNRKGTGVGVSLVKELVRCKDCKWWSKQKDSCQGHCDLFCNYPMYPTGAWFCANGERRKHE